METENRVRPPQPENAGSPPEAGPVKEEALPSRVSESTQLADVSITVQSYLFWITTSRTTREKSVFETNQLC